MDKKSSRSPLPSPAANDKDSPKNFEFLSVGSMVEASSDDEGFKGAWYVGKIIKTNKRKGKFMIEYQSLTCDEEPLKPLREQVDISFIRPVPPPPAADQSYELYDVVEAFDRDGWWKGIVSKVKILEGEERSSAKYTVLHENPAEELTFCSKDLRFHLVWADGKWSQPYKEAIREQPSNEKVTRSSAAKHRNEKQKSSSKRTRAETSRSKDESSAKKSRNNLSDVEEGDKGAVNVSEHSISNDKGTSSSAAKKESSSKRTRNEICRSKDKSYVRKTKSSPLDKGDQQNISEGNATETASEHCANKETEISFSKDNADVMAKTPPVVPAEDLIENVGESCNSVVDDQVPPANFGDKGHVENANPSPATAVQSDEGQVDNFNQSPPAMMLPCILSHIDDQVRPTHFESEGLVENANQSPAIMAQSNEEQAENLNQSTAITVQPNHEPVEEPAMPFTKNFSLWEHVDSLDVFQVMPQKPHLSPLFELSEVLREGHAIGLFLNFSRLVDTTSKMRADEPRKVFESNLEALADLESYGFEVKPVVDRLEKLLYVKTRKEELKNESKDAQTKMAKCNADEKVVEEKLRKTNKKISKLEKKRAVQVSEKLAKESERDFLQLAANEIEEQIKKADLDFENLASAPW